MPPQVFTLTAAEQETVTREVVLPDPTPPQFRVRVTAFNNPTAFNPQPTAVFVGETVIQVGQQSAILALVRNPDPATLIPVPATPTNLQQTAFMFRDGAAFGLSGTSVTLATGSFAGNRGDFMLASRGFMASGQVTIRSCDFLVTASSFPRGQGPQVGDSITIDPCQIDAIDRRLIVTNTMINTTSISEPPPPPVPAPVDSTITAPATHVTIPAGQAVTFQGTCTDPDNNTPFTFAWNFGASATPSTSTQQNPRVQFNSAGVFTVTLTCTNALGMADPTPDSRVIRVGTRMTVFSSPVEVSLRPLPSAGVVIVPVSSGQTLTVPLLTTPPATPLEVTVSGVDGTVLLAASASAIAPGSQTTSVMLTTGSAGTVVLT